MNNILAWLFAGCVFFLFGVMTVAPYIKDDDDWDGGEDDNSEQYDFIEPDAGADYDKRIY